MTCGVESVAAAEVVRQWHERELLGDDSAGIRLQAVGVEAEDADELEIAGGRGGAHGISGEVDGRGGGEGVRVSGAGKEAPEALAGGGGQDAAG